MSREIKFRAWDETDSWLGKVTSIDFDEESVYIETRYADDQNQFNLGEIPLMQYTGLKDKNGKEIYEGDILKFKTRKGYEYIGNIGVVNWSYMAYIIGTEVGEYLFLYLDEFEIIGNIYEHSHLLEGTA